MTDDGVMMNKWCCTGLLGEIGEICWYMYIHIHTTERFEFWWFIIIMISSVFLSPLGLEVQSQSRLRKTTGNGAPAGAAKCTRRSRGRQQLWETATGQPCGKWVTSCSFLMKGSLTSFLFKCCYIGGCITQMMQEDLEFERLKHDEIWWNYLVTHKSWTFSMMKWFQSHFRVRVSSKKLSHRKQGEQL